LNHETIPIRGGSVLRERRDRIGGLRSHPNLPQNGQSGALGAAGQAGASGQPFPGGAGGQPPGMFGGQPLPGGAAGRFGGAGGRFGGPGMPPGGERGIGGAGGLPLQPGGGERGFGGGVVPPGEPKQSGTSPQDDPNAKWIHTFVEVKNHSQKYAQTPYGFVYNFDHKWGKNNWRVFSPYLPTTAGIITFYMPPDTFAKDFDADFNKEKQNKDKNVKNFFHLARKALARGQMTAFHKVMEEAEKIDPKNAVVKKYLAVKKQLQSPFKDEDPAQRELIADLRSNGYKAYDSERQHYRLYAQMTASDAQTAATVKRRLALMEDTLDSFYFWFAMQEETGRQGDSARQPKLPRYRLNAILTPSKEEFTTRHLQWGQVPMAGDGFTPRRDNVVVLSSKLRLQDSLYNEYETILKGKIDEASQKLREIKIHLTREELLNGNLSDMKKTPEAGQAMVYIGLAQTAVLLSKALEDEAERHTITNESVRQLLIASEMFPRNVQIPEWMVEGLAAFFEIPEGALYPAIGGPSWTHLVSFKHFVKNNKLATSHDVLRNVVTDTYFLNARRAAKEAHERRDNDDLQRSAKEAWETARCTSWAFVYYLAQGGNLNYLFKYGDELDKLPRDMDLNDLVLQGSFAKAFDMTDLNNPRQIDDVKMKNEASKWFEMMQGVNLDSMTIQEFYLKQRAKLDGPPAKTPVSPNPNPGPNPSPNPNPGGGPNPFPRPGSEGQPNPMPNPKTGGNPNPFPRPASEGQPNPMPNPKAGGNPNPFPRPASEGQPSPNPNPAGGPKQGQGLAGTTWSGTETLQGYDQLSFQLNAGGQAIMTDKDGNTPGTWSQVGNSVTLGFDMVTYNGMIQGNRMQGNATNTKDRWNWTVLKR
jgi:hypothetical protein